MERLGKREWLGLAALFCLFAALFSFLPLRGHGRFLSPDETAVAVSAKLWAEKGSAAISESLAWKFPGLHPRSYVAHYDTIVPVGFLGWPFINAILIRIVGYNLLPLAAMLVILSAIYPLYRLLRPLGQNAALLGTLVAFSSPAIILYANRSLFPNAGLIALALWTCLLLKEMKREWQIFLAGILVCLTLAIRPVEIIWILPWFVYFGRAWKPTRNQILIFVFGILLAFIPLAWQSQTLYGNFLQAGYLLQGNPDTFSTATPVATSLASNVPFLPFGIHPLYIGWNIFRFLFGPLFPWMIPLMLAVVLGMQLSLRAERSNLAATGLLRRLAPRNDTQRIFYLGVWTFLVLILYYGNGRYADNITGAITIGNSFVRYLMPLGVLSGIAFAWVYAATESKKNGRIISGIMAAVLVFAGIFQAFFADAEGLWAVQNDPARYQTINQEAGKYFSSNDVIISERSDKIFFPEFRSWTPPPSMDDVARFASTQNIKIGLFARPMSQSQKDDWAKAGLNPVELYSNAREILYRLDPIK